MNVYACILYNKIIANKCIAACKNLCPVNKRPIEAIYSRRTIRNL